VTVFAKLHGTAVHIS